MKAIRKVAESELVPVGTDGKLFVVRDSAMTYSQFCKEQETTGIDIKESVVTPGRFFMTHDSGISLGPVSHRHSLDEILEAPIISLYKGDVTALNPTGFFYMLHKKGSSDASAKTVTRLSAF